MLLSIYLVSTGVSISIYGLHVKAFTDRVKKEGYEEVKVKRSFSDKIKTNLKRCFLTLTPVINVFCSAELILHSNEIYENAKKDSLNEGSLRKKETRDPIFTKELMEEFEAKFADVLEKNRREYEEKKKNDKKVKNKSNRDKAKELLNQLKAEINNNVKDSEDNVSNKEMKLGENPRYHI